MFCQYYSCLSSLNPSLEWPPRYLFVFSDRVEFFSLLIHQCLYFLHDLVSFLLEVCRRYELRIRITVSNQWSIDNLYSYKCSFCCRSRTKLNFFIIKYLVEEDGLFCHNIVDPLAHLHLNINFKQSLLRLSNSGEKPFIVRTAMWSTRHCKFTSALLL